jgi:hypothetical protein
MRFRVAAAGGYTSMSLLDDVDASLYRRFDNADIADAFAKGDMRISTLGRCKKYEDAERGDREEGVHRYESGDASSDDSHSEFAIVARRMGFDLDPDIAGLSIRNCEMEWTLVDAWVLCLSERDGDADALRAPYCVEILRPRRLFAAITDRLFFAAPHGPVRQACMGKVIYRRRSYAGVEDDPGPIGFVKPAIPYAKQREVRMLWIPRDSADLDYQQITCAVARRFCRRIS